MINKYKNKKVEFEGIKFDSKMEADFYKHLLKLFPKEQIIIQPVFELQPKFVDNLGQNIRAITYKADFQVMNIIYDVKGFKTIEFKIKEKMFKYTHKNLCLALMTKAPKYTGKEWIELKELEKIRKEKKCKK